jgi:hypothetical protein
LLRANAIFLGPGSPTYAARQLQGSLAWHALLARHRLGAALIFSSAATIAVGAYSLPVYEIYKVGEDLHWVAGLDLLGPYGLSLVLVPHWDNAEGGAALDTSRCFMGEARFNALRALLPGDATVVGIDEHTALVMDVAAGRYEVLGRGGVTWIRGGDSVHFGSGDTIRLSDFCPLRMPDPQTGIPAAVWETGRAAVANAERDGELQPPAEVMQLVEERRAARERRDWADADRLREAVLAQGWQIEDTPEGARLVPLG